MTGAPGGLVLSATTGRPCEELAPGEQWADLVDQLWQPAFPDPALVELAASMLPAVREVVGAQTEGPRWRLQVAPGAIAVGTKDYAGAYRSEENEIRRRQLDVDVAVTWLQEDGELPPDPIPSRIITEWSRKSRARMVRRLCELDYTGLYVDADGRRHGRLPAMVTLTYPGEWLSVAPTGKAVKAHLKAFRKRYRRAWGEDLACVWKLEFQHRGAPHIHLLCTPPHGEDQLTGLAFHHWLSRAWAEVVDHQDPEEKARHLLAGTGVDFNEGLRAKDPRRVAVYFLKHNKAGKDDKEYQHWVPEEWTEPGTGPGRFWGYWVLQPRVATVQVTPDDAVTAARVMRRWSRAQGRTRHVMRPRVSGGRVESRYPVVEGLAGAQLLAASGRVGHRRTTVRAVMVPRGRGWIAVNDGPAFAAQLARYLEQCHGAPRENPPPPPSWGGRRPDRAGHDGPLDVGTGQWRQAVTADGGAVGGRGDQEPTAAARVEALVDWQNDPDRWCRPVP